jgi:uncharacterized protein YjhX (UPF0386 family)
MKCIKRLRICGRFFAVVCVQRKRWVHGECRLFVVASLAKAALKSVRSGYKIRRHLGFCFQGF